MNRRGVIEHVGKQEWIANDPAIVVVGVFVGMQVSNWNAEREAFRMSPPNDVQRALNRTRGDRFVEPGDYAGTSCRACRPLRGKSRRPVRPAPAARAGECRLHG